MKAPLAHRPHWRDIGESHVGHVAAILAGLALMTAGISLATTVALLPLGCVLGFLGALMLGQGIFAHIQKPLRVSDWMDASIGLTGAAIAMTFTLAIVVLLVAFGLGIVGSLVAWLATLI